MQNINNSLKFRMRTFYANVWPHIDRSLIRKFPVWRERTNLVLCNNSTSVVLSVSLSLSAVWCETGMEPVSAWCLCFNTIVCSQRLPRMSDKTWWHIHRLYSSYTSFFFIKLKAGKPWGSQLPSRSGDDAGVCEQWKGCCAAWGKLREGVQTTYSENRKVLVLLSVLLKH